MNALDRAVWQLVAEANDRCPVRCHKCGRLSRFPLNMSGQLTHPGICTCGVIVHASRRVYPKRAEGAASTEERA